MKTYKEINELIGRGSEKLHNERNEKACCDLWLEAWEEIKLIMEKESLVDIMEVDDLYEWVDFIPNVVQDLEMELHNAGRKNSTYYEKRIVFCKELIQRCPSEELIRNNAKRAIAESYTSLGKFAEAEETFESLIKDEPNWSWGYLGFADYYARDCKPARYDKAAEIIETALQLPTLDEYDVLQEHAKRYFLKLDESEKLTPLGAKLKDCFEKEVPKRAPIKQPAQKSAPIEKAPKIGRNDPCSCGSGKKYKKCCL